MPDKELYKDIMTYVLSDSQHSDLLQIDELIYPDIDAKDIDAFIKGNAALLERSVLQGLQKGIPNESVVSIGDYIAQWMQKKYGLKIVRWEPNKTDYPVFMFLGGDRGILSYVEFFYHNADTELDHETISKFAICHNVKDAVSRISLVDSELDRPVFYVHIINYANAKGIFYETADTIKNDLLEKKKLSKDDRYYFPGIKEMGTLSELIDVLKDLKKNNVKFY